jgi:hypothetical protein
VLLLAPLVVVGAAHPATAAGATCDGLPATLVGKPGGSVQGTPFDDVIVSNGAEYVDGGDGNDVICTTGSVPHKNSGISVSGGRGTNVIDRRGDLDPAVWALVWLSGDSETYYGAPGPDQVNLGKTTPYTGPVSVQTGDGDDTVVVDNVVRFAQPATIDLGGGDDSVSVALTGEAPNFAVAGGDGHDTLTASEAGGPASWSADAQAGVLTLGSGGQLPFSGVDTYSFALAHPTSQVDFRGSTGPEELEVTGRGQVSSANLRGGDDVVRYTSYTKPRTTLKGGPGRDRLELLEDRDSDVHIDLGDHWFSAHSHHRNQLRQFEDASAMGAVVTIVGDGGDNDLEWWGCSGGPVTGGGGDDRIAPLPPVRVCSHVMMHADGGPGTDRLTGSPGPDVLDGGAGRDRTDGGTGADRCLGAEVAKSCEHRS